MTTEEKQMMQPTQEYIRKLQRKRNAGTENCMLSTDLAREMGITALDLHHFLIDVGFLFRERSTYELRLSKDYAGLGYAKTRSHFRYNKKGDPDEPIGIPSESPGRWMKVGRAMAIQENGTDSIDDFALLTGWDLCREALK